MRIGSVPSHSNLGDLDAAGQLGLGQQEDELLAAPARGDVLSAQDLGEGGRDALKQRVADQVAGGIVDVLETIQIGEDESRRPPGAARACLIRLPGGEEAAPVEQAGERVGARRLGEAGVGGAQLAGPVLDPALELGTQLFELDAFALGTAVRRDRGRQEEADEPRHRQSEQAREHPDQHQHVADQAEEEDRESHRHQHRLRRAAPRDARGGHERAAEQQQDQREGAERQRRRAGEGGARRQRDRERFERARR